MTTARRATSLTVALALAICLVIFAAATTHATNHCEFRLGFKTLRDLIGHEIVGECLENEHYNAIGDSNQRTTGGLLAWRKADNWTAFTDGYRTWINGPNGLVQRLNTERFPWEADYAPGGGIVPPTPTPVPPPPPPRPTAVPRPTKDPRLQDALNMIEETSPGSVYGQHGTVTTKNPKFTFGHIEHLAQYNIPTNTITVDESMRDQPLEVIAYLLVHEMSHARHPWTKYGYWKEGAEGIHTDYCFNNEHFAEWGAALWWDTRYGEAGHPNTDNARVRHANYAAWLRRHHLKDILEDGKKTGRFS